MIINRMVGAVRHAFGIQTKAEKKFQHELQVAVNKLEGETRDLFVKDMHGNIEHIKVSDAQVEKINKEHEIRARKAGIPRLDDPNHDRHNLSKFDDVWNPSHKK